MLWSSCLYTAQSHLVWVGCPYKCYNTQINQLVGIIGSSYWRTTCLTAFKVTMVLNDENLWQVLILMAIIMSLHHVIIICDFYCCFLTKSIGKPAESFKWQPHDWGTLWLHRIYLTMAIGTDATTIISCYSHMKSHFTTNDRVANPHYHC